MFKFQELIQRDRVSIVILVSSYVIQATTVVNFNQNMALQDKLAMCITTEHGKALKDAYADVLRGLGQFLYLLFYVNFSVGSG